MVMMCKYVGRVKGDRIVLGDALVCCKVHDDSVLHPDYGSARGGPYILMCCLGRC